MHSVRLLVGHVPAAALRVALLLWHRARIDHLGVLVTDHVGVLDDLLLADLQLAHGLHHPALGLLLDSLLDGGLHLLLPLAGLHVEPVLILGLELAQVGTLTLVQDLWATLLQGLELGLHSSGRCELLVDPLLLHLDPLLQDLVASLEEAGGSLLASLAAGEDILETVKGWVVGQRHIHNRFLALSLRRHVALAKDLVLGRECRQHQQHPLDIREVAFGEHDASVEPEPVGLAQQLLDQHLGSRRLGAVADACIVLVRHPELLPHHALEIGLVDELARELGQHISAALQRLVELLHVGDRRRRFGERGGGLADVVDVLLVGLAVDHVSDKRGFRKDY